MFCEFLSQLVEFHRAQLVLTNTKLTACFTVVHFIDFSIQLLPKHHWSFGFKNLITGAICFISKSLMKN